MDNRFSFSDHKVFDYFYRINQVPRCSNDEERIEKELVSMGQELGLETITDSVGNVLITKPAAEEFTNAPRIIIQGHMDMVCEKDKDSDHDFCNDPIEMYEEGNWIHSKKTTLGADDAIGVAMGLALLTEKDPMPEIKVLVTKTEETGMDGAIGLAEEFLDAEMLINIDSEEEGYITVGCAGGSTGFLSLDLQRDDMLENSETLQITISGMRGGHSGMEIANVSTNAMKSMSLLLRKLSKDAGVRIHSIHSGSKHNAIPNEAQSIISFAKEDSSSILEILEKSKNLILENLLKLEPDVRIEWERTETQNQPLSVDSTTKLLSFIDLVPHGVYSMKKEGDSVETSNNLAVIETLENEAKFVISVRSSNEEKLAELQDKIRKTMDMFSGTTKFGDGYPAWEYKDDSVLREIFSKEYKKLSNEEMKVLLIHAGLECGMFAEKNPNLDMVSFGPDVLGAHTTKERVSIESVYRSYDLLKKVVSEISKLRV